MMTKIKWEHNSVNISKFMPGDDFGFRFILHFSLFTLRSMFFLCLLSLSAFAQNPVQTMNMEDIRDIQPPVDYPVNWIPWLILVGIVLFGILVAYLLKGHVHPVERVPSEPVRPAWVIAQDALSDFKKKNYPGQGLVKLYFSELSDILRRYIEARFDINAPDMTTEEFLESLRFSGTLREEHQARLQNFLTSCDMVKFAKYGASSEEMNKSFEMVEDFVRQTIPKDTAIQ